MNIPHEEIRERGDRSWSMRLFEELVATRDEDVVTEICKTIEALEDYRLEKPLFEVVLNQANDDFVRRSAIHGLCVVPTTDTEEQRRTWWHSGDEILRKLAANLFERTEDDLILEILTDCSHPLYSDAISKISMGGYEQLKFQKFLVEAFSHTDAEVREDASRGVVFAEPVIAEDGLISLINDPDADVFDGVMFTLSWFSSQKVILGLHQNLQHCATDRKSDLGSIIGGVTGKCFESLQNCKEHSAAAEHYFQEWLKPVLSILEQVEVEKEIDSRRAEQCEVDSRSSKKKIPKSKNVRPSVKSLISELDNPNGNWRKIRYGGVVWHRVDWASYGRLDRKRLTDFFANHLDPTIREIGCPALAVWNEADLLLQFLNATSFSLRRSAAYNLKDLGTDEKIAEILWQQLLKPGVEVSYAREMLDSLEKHERQSTLAEKLLAYIEMDRGESLRTSALRKLVCLGAEPYLKPLVKLLKEEPSPSWMFHTELIEMCAEFKFDAPNISFLKTIDDFDFQAAFCIYLAERS
ncbi:MAG: hypothetical protein JST89_05125 [Cyanobacteria bacterium SZAS-4]|nr:hypothetical protein [Cyanobacteria bacterium SZAS-4]